jgi:hypothetical protein
MKSIRNFAYATLLTLSALNFAPSLASAQDEGGSFKLSHDVYWQNAVVPAGDYRFSLQPEGPSVMLKLTKVSGTPASFMLLVNDTDGAATSGPSRLVIDSKSGASYVSLMELPQFEIKLHFAAPIKATNEIAQTTTVAAARPAR